MEADLTNHSAKRRPPSHTEMEANARQHVNTRLDNSSDEKREIGQSSNEITG
jgi:hypothetical protein